VAAEVEAEPAPEQPPEPEPAVAEDQPAPEPQPEPVTAEPWLQAAQDEPEPDLAAVAEPEIPVAQAEPAPEPVVASAAAEPTAPPDSGVTSTMLRWPGGTSPGNGAQSNAQPETFDEATSIIPAWQHPLAPSDSRRTVSLQAMPPEQLASGGTFAAMLTFESGPFVGRIVALPNQMVSVGRAPDNDVVVGDPATSGHHGRLEVRSGFFWISDLGSTNGTLVNGEPVIEKQLNDGDQIAIGQNVIRFSLES
jgi:hypothetical protein